MWQISSACAAKQLDKSTNKICLPSWVMKRMRSLIADSQRNQSDSGTNESPLRRMLFLFCRFCHRLRRLRRCLQRLLGRNLVGRLVQGKKIAGRGRGHIEKHGGSHGPELWSLRRGQVQTAARAEYPA